MHLRGWVTLAARSINLPSYSYTPECGRQLSLKTLSWSRNQRWLEINGRRSAHWNVSWFFFLFLFSCVACDMLSWFTHKGKGAFLWLTDAHYCRFSKSWAMMVKTSLTNALSIWIILYLQSLLSQAFEKKFHHRVVLYWLHQNLYVFWWQNIQLVKIWFSKHQIFTGNSLSPLTLVITQ